MREKFSAWAASVPYTLRNPLHHWTHLELQRHFGISVLQGPETADGICEEALEQLPHLRVLCNLLGRDMEGGELPDDPAMIGAMVREICFENARDFLGLELGEIH